ncbi:MAG: alcohol dehydrogenase catalytic domain-containing protein [Phycisphaerae bacterium]|nr:alcohol dehydrogenase catalytic domain-containing protein [Phycisphaerae bacterium]
MTINCQKQTAVQLVGPDELKLNTEKSIPEPAPYQILAQVEAVGLCFSDLKLLKQFDSHARKSEVTGGVSKDVLEQVPSYVPQKNPTVPGHEAVVRICKIGDKVENVKSGDRYLVQTDYRWLPTKSSNAAFGYNFEGALQQYVIMDQRVITSPDGDSMLIPASDTLSASAIALVEPWACVEDAYAVKERTILKEGGKMLVVVATEFSIDELVSFIGRFGKPAEITFVDACSSKLEALDIPVKAAKDISELPDASFDDVIYYGSDNKTVEQLFSKVASHGLLNIVLCGGKFTADVCTQVGRVHYGGIRIIGTTGSDSSESMQYIPDSGEIRKSDNISVIGAGGPMGVMHVVRNLCQGVQDVTVFASDLDDQRLAALTKIAEPIAQKNNVGYKPINPKKDKVEINFDYISLMAPVPILVTNAVKDAAQKAIINIFAGIPANVTADIDLNRYIENQMYFIGTSGSTLEDMKVVLSKVESGSLDTNISVAAVCGLESAVEGIRAVENHIIPGKIIVYPACKNLALTTLDKLKDTLPDVHSCLNSGIWAVEAEKALIDNYTK